MDKPEITSLGRVERKKEETRQKIIVATMQLIKLHGYDAVTMEQIADTADIAKGTLYHYYPVKEAIISDFIDRESVARNAERIIRMRLMPDTRTRMIASLTDLMEAVNLQKEIFKKYFTYRTRQMITLERNANRVSGLHLLETEIILLGQEQGEIRSDLPIEMVEALYEFIFIELAQQLYLHPERFNKDETILHCVDLFMNGAKRPE
jgi:AcrR family transcriptional regulator